MKPKFQILSWHQSKWVDIGNCRECVDWHVSFSCCRSLPDLRVQAETSIMSILRWNFKSKMEKTISSFGNGHISMVSFFTPTTSNCYHKHSTSSYHLTIFLMHNIKFIWYNLYFQVFKFRSLDVCIFHRCMGVSLLLYLFSPLKMTSGFDLSLSLLHTHGHTHIHAHNFWYHLGSRRLYPAFMIKLLQKLQRLLLSSLLARRVNRLLLCSRKFFWFLKFLATLFNIFSPDRTDRNNWWYH